MKKNNYLILESLIGSISVYMILRKLMADWKDWDAFKVGIIDKDGNKKKHPITSKEREAWDILTRLCWNIKKITSKYIGKNKFAQYFSAAYLLKDSVEHYVVLNHEKLNESLLSDMTFAKQSLINTAMKKISGHNNLAITTPENIVEHEIIKLSLQVEKILEEFPEIEMMFEDEGGATVQGDIAQHGQYLGSTKKINPLKLANVGLNKLKKKKRKIDNESN